MRSRGSQRIEEYMYVNDRTLPELREIKAQQSLSSDDKVVEYLITRHKYLQYIASPTSKLQTAVCTGQMARLSPVNAVSYGKKL